MIPSLDFIYYVPNFFTNYIFRIVTTFHRSIIVVEIIVISDEIASYFLNRYLPIQNEYNFHEIRQLMHTGMSCWQRIW